MCPRCVQPEVENFKKLNVISQDEFDTLTPKVPIDPNQEVPTPPMQGESRSDARAFGMTRVKKHSNLFFLRSGECRRAVPLSAHLGARVAPRSAAAHAQNATHARAPGPQQDAEVLPRDEGEQHRGRTGEHAESTPLVMWWERWWLHEGLFSYVAVSAVV